MTDAKFTPGPWVAHETGRARSGVPEHEIHWTDDGECVAEVVHGTANAQLIAAAPELYEALTRCKFDSLNMTDADLEFCKAAMAEARGIKARVIE